MTPPTGEVRILVADDHALLRRGLCAELAARPGWSVVGEAADGREAVKLAGELAPDIVILDLSMPLLNGLEAARQIRRISPRTEILVLTMHDSEELVREVLLAGVQGYVLKSDASRVLARAVESLARHQPFFSRSVADCTARLSADPRRADGGEPVEADRLTPREREIVQLVAEGRSSKEIAEALGIALKTVEAHRANLMHKLGLRSASELTRYAIRNRIIQA